MKCPKCYFDNPEDTIYCGKCATPLPPSREIPFSQTETLHTPIKELTTGSTFANRYQVIEELGKGGMGRVYKVFDTDIKEKVALKLLKPEIASDKETIERFSNELKYARKISHRNVCRMYDLGKTEGTYFITMEYVHGEDLKSMIRMSTGLTVGTVLSVGKQVCDGLAEAHSLGVVHRDLKPQNIMIDKGGNAKIMDFGIARSIREKGITGPSVLIGTPEYMSPEQAEAKEIDHRSDIYSLGIILYEMATGRVPFEGETALSIAMKHKGEIPKNPKQFNPNIPDDLSGVILKCLEKDKAKRYQTAADVRSELEKIEKGIPTTERVMPERKTLTSRQITVQFSLKKLFVPALIFVALIVIGAILWRIVPSKRPAPPPSASGQPTLAVLYFENKSGDKELDFWRNALPELLITDLSQSKYIRVVSGDEMLTILRRLGLAEAQEYSSEDIGKIAAQTRATHVLRGSFIKAGESIIITAGLQKPGTGETARTLRLEARSENDIIPKVNELTRQVKEGFNLTATQIASDIEKEVGKITTSSPEALKYYIEGRRLHSKMEYEQAIAYMEKAVEIDPEFAMAYRSMAAAHGNMGHQAEARKYHRKALELSSRLPENERLLVEADQFRRDENYARAIEVYEKLLKAYPGHLTGHSLLAVAYASAGDYDKAIEHQEFEVQNRKTVIAVTNLAEGYMAKGLYQKAEDICRSFLQDVEDNLYVRVHLFASYVCRRQFDLAFTEAEKIQFLAPSRKGPIGQVFLFRDDIAGAEKILGGNALLLIRGQFNKNVSLRLQILEKSKGDKGNEARAYWGLASVLEKAGRYEEALQALDQYLKLSAENRKAAAESGLPYLPSEQKSDLFIKGRIQAEMKSFDEAQKTAEELKSLIEKGINMKELRYYEYILGLIGLGKKNSRKAAGLFDRACGRLEFEGLGDESNHAMYFDGLARALYESGDLDKARKEFEKITLLTIGRAGHGDIYARAYYMLGKIAEQRDDKVKAIENYTKFLDLWKDADPGQPEVDDAGKRLAGLK
jgi:serine/threonine protein kinase/Flp pilus assembly protein TadD